MAESWFQFSTSHVDTVASSLIDIIQNYTLNSIKHWILQIFIPFTEIGIIPSRELFPQKLNIFRDSQTETCPGLYAKVWIDNMLELCFSGGSSPDSISTLHSDFCFSWWARSNLTFCSLSQSFNPFTEAVEFSRGL